MTVVLTGRARRLRDTIHGFIEARFLEKTEKLEPDSEAFAKRELEYEPYTWLESAASRSGQIQVVTHPLKATYPDAKLAESSSLFAPPAVVSASDYVSSRLLGSEHPLDVTGNAAALDVYGLLRQEFEGKTLLALCDVEDPDLLLALNDDPETASSWLAAFRGVTTARTPQLSSSNGAKQLLWLTGDDALEDASYCVLSPMYPSHLSTRIFLEIQEHRFSEDAKEARKARRAKQFHASTVYEYSGLAKTVIGGANPQNISQLNSGRRGANYRFSNLPPVWKNDGLRPLYGIKSLFDRFEKTADAARITRRLRRFLETDPPATIETRTRVQRDVNDLIDALLAYAAPYQDLSPGWTAHEYCLLSNEEQLWLDPLRAVDDDAFFNERQADKWPDELGRRFASRLNKLLGKKLPMSDVEHRHWRDELTIDDTWMTLVHARRAQREKNPTTESVE